MESFAESQSQSQHPVKVLWDQGTEPRLGYLHRQSRDVTPAAAACLPWPSTLLDKKGELLVLRINWGAGKDSWLQTAFLAEIRILQEGAVDKKAHFGVGN